RGILVDRQILSRLSGDFAQTLARLEDEIHEMAGEKFSLGSPKQIGDILFGKMGLPGAKKTPSGQWATPATLLDELAQAGHELPAKILEWRQLSKLKSTYTDTLQEHMHPETKRVHTSFSLASTTTGRLSSSDPNLQNIPIRTEIGRPVRACFVAEEGNRLLSCDYSQVELRVLAHVADEKVLKDVLHEGEDVHAATAAEVFEIERDEVDVGQRSKAKMVNFGIVYGLTGFGLSDRLNIPRKEGEEFVSRYLERFPAVRAFREEVIERAQEEGYVTTLMGRRRPIPELRSGNPNTRRLGERLAVNTVIQGTAADIIKVAMVRCFRALREKDWETRLVLQIHDELLFEGPPEEMEAAAELVQREMCAAYPLDPPLEVDVGIGSDWLEAK
ncbi:MAG TPA: DNA polymerase, partial [Solirubrobacterales bacterium]|nr:DNA polymerase [Solirubrobacterales bacterium]